MEEKIVSHDPSLILSKKLLWAWKSGGFTSATVEGTRGIGKSSYAIKCLADVFYCQGYDIDVSWDMAIDRILYRIDDVIEFLDKSTKKRKQEVCFCWDDAGVFAGSGMWFSDPKMVHLLQSMMDTIRGSVSGMILTCPNQGQLLKFLRRYDSYLIRVSHTTEGGFTRWAKGYQWTSLPSGKRLIRSSFDDSFSCRLPNEVYYKYMRKRKKYNKENIENLKAARERYMDKNKNKQIRKEEVVKDEL
jgi:hypothetical protein